MTRSLQQLDATMHDPAQTHLSSYADGARGPYPEHPHGSE